MPSRNSRPVDRWTNAAGIGSVAEPAAAGVPEGDAVEEAPGEGLGEALGEAVGEALGEAAGDAVDVAVAAAEAVAVGVALAALVVAVLAAAVLLAVTVEGSAFTRSGVTKSPRLAAKTAKISSTARPK